MVTFCLAAKSDNKIKFALTINEARGVAAVEKTSQENIADSGAAVGEMKEVLTVYPLFL